MHPRLARRDFGARLRRAEEGIDRFQAANDRLEMLAVAQMGGQISIESAGRLTGQYGDEWTRDVEEACRDMAEGIQMMREGPLSSPATTLKLVVL